jgi:hypothetical protein
MTHYFDRFIQSPARVFAVLPALALACYLLRALPSPFKTGDDYFSIVENLLIRDFTHLPEIFIVSFFGDSTRYRPLVTVCFLPESKAGGLNLVWFNPAGRLPRAITGRFF